MCLVVLSWQPDGDQWLTLASNRDEFLQRPTQPLHPWQPDSGSAILAGRDVRQGGTWLAVNRQGNFAALTNIRRLGVEQAQQVSRGQLVVDALATMTAEPESVTTLIQGIEAENYAPFNLLIGNRQQLLYLTNYDLVADQYRLTSQKLAAGCYGLSNAHLDTPWPKIRAAKHQLQQWQKGAIDCELSYLLTSTELANDDQLPNTGVPIEFERRLSAAFIRTDLQGKNYGTRSSAAILANGEQVEFTEVQWQPESRQPEEQTRQHYKWMLAPAKNPIGL